jgi:cadmium resistance protein CadD (predicted permease)
VLTALGFALIAAIEPLGIVAYIAILLRGGRRDTWGFVVGWMLCAGLVAAITMLLAGGVEQHDSSGVVSSAGLLQIALGIAALVLLAVRRARSRVDPDAPEKPVIPERDDAVGPVGAAVIAALLQGWPVVAAAVAAVLSSTDSDAGRVVGILVVIVVATSTYLTAQVLSGLRPEPTARLLDRLSRWIGAHRDRAIDLILLGAGVWLVLHGLVVQLGR